MADVCLAPGGGISGRQILEAAAGNAGIKRLPVDG